LAFDGAFDLKPLGTQPFVCCRKRIRNERCLSEASFVLFPFFAAHKWAPEGQVCGRLSFAYLFFGEAKKSKWLPGHTRLASTKCNRYELLHFHFQVITLLIAGYGLERTTFATT
jgi:hypothetical protein